MSTRTNKAKARRLQQWVCEKLASISGCSYGREEAEIQSRPMDHKGVDVILRERAAIIFPYAFECKANETVSFMQAIRQAKKNGKETDRDWIVVLRRSDIQRLLREPLVLMSWSTLAGLFEDRIFVVNVLEEEEE